MLKATVEIVYNKLPKLSAEVAGHVDDVIDEAAFRVERGAKDSAPVDTGFLRSSIYTVTTGGSGYAHAASAAESAADRGMLPEVAQPAAHQAIVAVGAEYGIFVEYGTSRMTARPFVRPAVEKVRAWFLQAIKSIVKV